MANYNSRFISKEELDTNGKIGIEETIDVYTAKYPLLEPQKITRNDNYQIARNADIILDTISGYDFLQQDNLISYLNLPSQPDSIHLRFGSDGSY